MNNNLILVNKKNKVDRNYIPNDLITVSDNKDNYLNLLRPDYLPKVTKETLENFNRLQEDAKEKGFILIITSGYRSYEYQEELIKFYLTEKDQDYVDRYVAQPGTSEHQTGLAIDIASLNEENKARTLNEEEINYLKNNAYKFGFIERYQEGKEDITGYSYEPWHYRYVGIKHAKHIYENKLTFEEYIEEITIKEM